MKRMQITQSNRWIELLRNKDEFSGFLAFIREEKVKSIELDGIKIEFQEAKYVSSGEPQVDKLPDMTEEQKKKEEEELMFWSSGV